jgi:hypothetical protein
MELLGPAFAEQQLLSLGYAIEQTLHLRDAIVDLTYDQTTGRLHYALKSSGPGRERLSAIWIHTGGDKPAAARHQLYAPGQSLTGEVTLSSADRRDLADGRLVARFYLHDQAGSAGDVIIRLKPE